MFDHHVIFLIKPNKSLKEEKLRNEVLEHKTDTEITRV